MHTSDWLALALSVVGIVPALIGFLGQIFPPETRRAKQIVTATFLLFVIAGVVLVVLLQIRLAKDRVRTEAQSKSEREEERRFQKNLPNLVAAEVAKLGSNITPAQVQEMIVETITKHINRSATIANGGKFFGSIQVVPNTASDSATSGDSATIKIIPPSKSGWLSPVLTVYGALVLIWYCSAVALYLAGLKLRLAFWLRGASALGNGDESSGDTHRMDGKRNE
jgi:hypothetical protein